MIFWELLSKQKKELLFTELVVHVGKNKVKNNKLSTLIYKNW
jgi:hypothetical protein